LRHFLTFAGVLTLAGVLALSGCKQSSNQQANNQPANNQQPNNQQPYAGETVGQPAAAPSNSMPGVPSAQAPAAEPQSAEQGAPGAYDQGAYNQAQQAPAGAAAPAAVQIPAGMRLEVRLGQSVGSKISYSGESFSATMADDVVVNGTTVIPRGARAEGTVVEAKALGHIKGRAVLALRLERVQTDWGSYPVDTSTVERVRAGKGRRSAKFIGGGAGLGGLIGGLAGGGKGLLIGAAAGAAAGTAGGAFTGNHQIVLPAGTVLTFRLERPVQVAG
jgi:hypothetical protein